MTSQLKAGKHQAEQHFINMETIPLKGNYHYVQKLEILAMIRQKYLLLCANEAKIK